MIKLQVCCGASCLLVLLGFGPAVLPAWTEEATVVPAAEHQLGNAHSVAFSRDGRLVAAGFGGPATSRFPLEPNGGKVVVWETESGKVVSTRGEYGDLINLQFTHDGKACLLSRIYTPGDSVDDHLTCLIGLDGTMQRRWSGSSSCIAAASPIDGQIAIVEGRDICRIYDLSVPHQPREDARVLSIADSFSGRCLAFSADGAAFVAVHGVLEPIVRDGKTMDGRHAIRTKGLTVFNTADWRVRESILSDDLLDCTALEVSRDGRWIATGHGQGIVRIWDGKSLKKSTELNLHSATAVLPRFSPDGSTLAVLTQPANSPVWRYADTDSGFEFGREQVGTRCHLVLFKTDDFELQRRFLFEDGVFRTYHANRPKESLNPARLAFSPDGQQILVGCNGVVLLDVARGTSIRQFQMQNDEK